MTGSKKILIIEDNPDIIKIYGFLLEKNGYDVGIAQSGKQALSLALDFNPDVILLDIMIPDIDGLEVLNRIRTEDEYKDINPLVLVTTNVVQDDISEKAKKYGADGFLVKAHIDAHELPEIVEELLNRVKSKNNVQTDGNSVQ